MRKHLEALNEKPSLIRGARAYTRNGRVFGTNEYTHATPASGGKTEMEFLLEQAKGKANARPQEINDNHSTTSMQITFHSNAFANEAETALIKAGFKKTN